MSAAAAAGPPPQPRLRSFDRETQAVLAASITDEQVPAERRRQILFDLVATQNEIARSLVALGILQFAREARADGMDTWDVLDGVLAMCGAVLELAMPEAGWLATERES